MERPIFKPVGTPVADLDTPALVVDLAAMESNIDTFHAFFRQSSCKVRPNASVHKCPAIAHRQLRAGGTAGGIGVATVGEGEIFAQAGFTDILVSSRIVTLPKISRLCALARQCRVTVAVDNAVNVKDLAEGARTFSATLYVLLDVSTQNRRGGLSPGRPALNLARVVAQTNGLHFAGLTTYAGPLLEENREHPGEETKKQVQLLLDTRETLEQAGLPIESVSVAEPDAYEIVGRMDGVTEIRAGFYALMDARHREWTPQFAQAARVLSTIISRPDKARAVSDAGHKSLGQDWGLPVVEGIPGAKVARISAEHCALDLDGPAQERLDLGAKVWLVPRDVRLCANLHDYIHAVRGGRLEAVWEVAARGRYD